MRRLLVMRHAKSSWADDGLADHERPLNDRGRRTTPVVGALLAAEGWVPDQVLSSTALRTRQTTEQVLEAADHEAPVTWSQDLYLADPATIFRVIRQHGAGETLLVVGHNPGLEDFVGGRTGAFEAMPTGALAVFYVPIDAWADLTPDTACLLERFVRPKELAETPR